MVLGVLVRLWGGLSVMVGVSLLLLSAGAAALASGPGAEAVGLAAGLTAGAFAALGILALCWGAAHVMAAALIHRRRGVGRIVTLALGILNLVVLPFGTALGIYALWVLLTHDGRRLFERATIPSVSHSGT